MAVVVALIGLLAIVAALASGLHLMFRLTIAGIAALYAVHQVFRLLYPRWKALAFDPDELILIDRRNQLHRLTLSGRPFVSPLYIGMTGQRRNARSRRRLGLFRNQLDPEQFRRLAAGLRTRFRT